MILKEEVLERCSECNSVKNTVSARSYGCDGCGKSIDDLLAKQRSNHQYNEYLEATVFYIEGHDPDTERLQFCSWKCVFAKLRKLPRRAIRFISLPYVSYDLHTPGMTHSALYELVGRPTGR